MCILNTCGHKCFALSSSSQATIETFTVNLFPDVQHNIFCFSFGVGLICFLPSSFKLGLSVFFLFFIPSVVFNISLSLSPSSGCKQGRCSVFILIFCFFLGLWIRDRGEVLAEALKLMLCEDRQHDMQKAAGFVKRLATFSLCFGSAESMAGILFMCSYLISYQKPVGMLLFYLSGSSLGLCSLGYIKASSSEEYQMPESVRK